MKTTPRLSRRDFLKLAMLAGGGGLLASCNLPQTPPGGSAVPGTGTLTPQVGATLPSVATSATAQARPEQKIKNIIILIEENHSFDSIFANFPGADGVANQKTCPLDITEKINDITMPNTPYVCSYTEELLPNYWKMARSFTLCDNYFSEVKTESDPNFMMLGTAQATTMKNPPGEWGCPNFCVDVPAFPDLLDPKGLTWHDYGGTLAFVQSLQGRSEITGKSLSGFFDDAARGTLQNVIWINTFLLGGNKTSGHPPGNICDAENYAVDIVNAVMNSPQWNSTLLFIVWDEWGGFPDHIKPPIVEKLLNGEPFRYGLRVPCIVISPYARRGYVSHTEYSHMSLLKTIETIFDLKSLNQRDASAKAMLDCLDFTQPPSVPDPLTKRACLS